jgi:hypothetical protein
MKRIRPHSLGTIIGIQFASWHVGWSFLVWIGWAQRLIDFIFELYMFTPTLRVAGFNFLTAAQLSVLAGCFGYSLGSFAALMWNLFMAEEPSSHRDTPTSRATVPARPV